MGSKLLPARLFLTIWSHHWLKSISWCWWCQLQFQQRSFHGKECSHGCTVWTALRYSIAETSGGDVTASLKCLFVCEESHYCQVCQFHGNDFVEYWAEMNKHQCGVEGRWGPVGSECKLLRVQAGWDVAFDVLGTRLSKHFIRMGCHRADIGDVLGTY